MYIYLSRVIINGFLPVLTKWEEGGSIAVGDGCNCIFAYAEMLCHASADVGNVAALVALPAIRHGCKIGRIGFEHDAVDAYFGQNCRDSRFLEGDYAIDAKVEVA